MGKIRENSSIFGEAHGKIGNNVLAKTKYGTQVKSLPKPHFVIPPGQLLEMEYMDYVSKIYDTITEQEAGYWRLWGEYPWVRRLYTKKKHIDGRNLFFAVNMKRIEIGEPVIISIPHFNSTQVFNKIKIEIIKVKNRKDLILEFSPEIKENIKLVVTATRGLKDNLLHIPVVEYKKIAILDSSFKSGDSLRENYLRVHDRMPEAGKKISFNVTSVNKECGADSMPFKINVHQDDGDRERLRHELSENFEKRLILESLKNPEKTPNKRGIKAK
jgi:hypothetical protein